MKIIDRLNNGIADNDRQYWIQTMCRIADPVLSALSTEQLKHLMPVEGRDKERRNYSHLEAFGRLICGMAPWIEKGPATGDEGKLRKEYAALIRRGMEVITDPKSSDYLNFSHGQQPLVDAAFLSHAIIRAPNELYFKLTKEAKQNLIKSLKMTRTIKPYFNNWLLFSAIVETTLYLLGEEWDRVRVDYAIAQHDQWYVGDGMYRDGPEFHMDYYNSFVIQPMMVDILDRLQDEFEDWELMKERVNKRAKRFAVIQERSISPEGTFPVVGRSITYRFGVFQHLAQMALQHKLDNSIQPAQVRCALTKVIRRLIEMPGTFDENGWLQIGLCGSQPELGESYISTGSLYLCATVFLPLGLSENDPYWLGHKDWTSKKIWSGKDIPIDTALS